jgi:AcrR family transcriptional regulator
VRRPALPSGSSSRPGGRSARVRAAVITATLDLLLERGGDAASVAEIAQRAGVHETSIYRRWGTREALLLDAMLSRAEELLPVPDTGSLRADLVDFLRDVVTLLQSSLGASLARMSPQMTDSDAVLRTRRAYWSRRFNLARTMFQRAVQRGELPAGVDLDLALDLLIGPLYLRLLVTGEPLDLDLAERIVGLVLDGLTGSRRKGPAA